jgi:uncharacterized protein (TIGR04551 family)
VIAWVALLLCARVGTGDPGAEMRDRKPDEDAIVHGHLRLRAFTLLNGDLDSTLDPRLLADARARLVASAFVGEEFRIHAALDGVGAVGDGATQLFGGTPRMWGGACGRACATATLRAAQVDWFAPFGVVSVGRAQSHFGLGIGTNAGDELDDDGGDYADRISVVSPLFGHFVALAFDVSPGSRALPIGEQSLSFGVMRWHAPWELAMLRDANRTIFDYGAAFVLEWAAQDAPGVVPSLSRAIGIDDPYVVRRDARMIVIDGWVRFVRGPLRLEAEAFAADLLVDNPSPWRGVVVREPIVGNPFAAVGVAELALLERTLLLQLESGVASGDPAPGLPPQAPGDLVLAQPGDAFGAQVDLKRGGDNRFDAAGIHPSYRIDLILWRTLLGGVAEAAYARAKVTAMPLAPLLLEANAVYSHALFAESTTGGIAPLGFELDGAATLAIGAGFSARVDAGVLFPFGGLAQRGGVAPTPAGLVLVRCAYAL